ncbi:type II CRISPR-associated endonuclease Cas1 [uncultured Tistrella sp.]|uniref:type II CRISPR-associated endonuclease Cas1 n=1 Tax=Tistrella mobilis TaxID=171437 RepID=UPI000C09BF41|nr:type II CRISPR-associated endonuclease Cas1 [uncultured Tistrella sp.]MAM76576.1 subtype II CRISPR-associated endonuclease Cas1 [Tistrella sp.]
MLRRTIAISSGPTRLSVAHRQLVIDRQDQPRATVPIEDIGTVVVDHPAVTYTHDVLVSLADAGAGLVVCGRGHLPVAMLVATVGHGTQTARHIVQVDATPGLKRRLWGRIIRTKILLQADVAQQATGQDDGLAPLAARVKPGDPENLEAQAAQRYFKAVFGQGFRRRRDGATPNDLLNYGYAIMRSSVARAVVASGLAPALGLHHRHRNNPFCLADDLIEPFRPMIDRVVLDLCRAAGEVPEIDRRTKEALLSVLRHGVVLSDGRRTPVDLAIRHAAASLGRSFEERKDLLILPASLPDPDLDLTAQAEEPDAP